MERLTFNEGGSGRQWEETAMFLRAASITLLLGGLAALTTAEDAHAQQSLGNGVYVCNGAAQAGPNCNDDDDGDNRGGRRQGGYTDNDYLRGMSFAGFRDQWGALTSGPPGTNYYGYSNSYGTGGDDTRAEAEQGALEQCEHDANWGKSTNDRLPQDQIQCEVVYTFMNGCGAIVTGPERGRFFGIAPIQGRRGDDQATEAARQAAVARAMRPCEEDFGAGRCEMQKTMCAPPVPTYAELRDTLFVIRFG